MRIPKEVWGATISGIIGIGLFFLQKFVEVRGKEKNLLFQIYQLIRMPNSFHSGRDIDSIVQGHIEYQQHLADISGLAVMLKNRSLARDILIYSLSRPQDKIKEIELLKKIANKLNKKTRKIIDKIEEEEKLRTLNKQREKEAAAAQTKDKKSS